MVMARPGREMAMMKAAMANTGVAAATATALAAELGVVLKALVEAVAAVTAAVRVLARLVVGVLGTAAASLPCVCRRGRRRCPHLQPPS